MNERSLTTIRRDLANLTFSLPVIRQLAKQSSAVLLALNQDRRSIRTELMAEQESIANRSTRVTYWEGAVQIRGKVRNKAVTGNDTVAMTGYAGKLTI